jgi:hypothetical protein
MRRILPVLLLAVVAATGAACSSNGSATPPSTSAAPSGAGAPGATNAVDTNAYCQAAQQLVQLDAKSKSGTSIDPKDVQTALAQINASAPANVKQAWGQLFLNPSGNSSASQQVINDYNKATCNITQASS